MNRLHQLATNEDGFAFNPETGESYTVNTTGLFIINQLKQDKPRDIIAKNMIKEFDVSIKEAKRDIDDFMDHLRTDKLIV